MATYSNAISQAVTESFTTMVTGSQTIYQPSSGQTYFKLKGLFFTAGSSIVATPLQFDLQVQDPTSGLWLTVGKYGRLTSAGPVNTTFNAFIFLRPEDPTAFQGSVPFSGYEVESANILISDLTHIANLGLPFIRMTTGMRVTCVGGTVSGTVRAVWTEIKFL